MRGSVRPEVLMRMLMVYYVKLRDLTVGMISDNIPRASLEHSPSLMPEYERDIFSLEELMKTKLASAKASR